MEAACPVDEMVAAMLPGSGGKGIAGGGDGSDATDADLRRCEVVEFERLGPLSPSAAWTSSNLAYMSQ